MTRVVERAGRVEGAGCTLLGNQGTLRSHNKVVCKARETRIHPLWYWLQWIRQWGITRCLTLTKILRNNLDIDLDHVKGYVSSILSRCLVFWLCQVGFPLNFLFVLQNLHPLFFCIFLCVSPTQFSSLIAHVSCPHIQHYVANGIYS